MKKLTFLLTFVLLFAVVAPFALAQTASTTCPGGGTLNPQTGSCNLGYTQLEPIPGLTQFDSNSLVNPNNLSAIINAIFKILITAGALIAVLSLTFGGVQYMVSGSAGGKNAGMKRAQAALWGILLIAASWLILYTINPALLNFSLNPCPQGSTGCTVTATAPISTGAGAQTVQLTSAQAQQISTANEPAPIIGTALLYNNSDAASSQVAQQYSALQKSCTGGSIIMVSGIVMGGTNQQTAQYCAANYSNGFSY